MGAIVTVATDKGEKLISYIFNFSPHKPRYDIYNSLERDDSNE